MQTNIESQISAMAYLDLMLRSVTEPGLLRIFVKFLLDEDKFDGQRMIDILIERINSTDSRVRTDSDIFSIMFSDRELRLYPSSCAW